MRIRAANCRSIFPFGRAGTALLRTTADWPSGRCDEAGNSPTPDEKYLSRYIDEQNSAQFPFGWGLSYTDFRYTPPMVKQPRLSLASLEEARGSGKAAFQIAADVTNTGTVAGSAVVQLYLRDTVASIERPLRELKGFPENFACSRRDAPPGLQSRLRRSLVLQSGPEESR